MLFYFDSWYSLIFFILYNIFINYYMNVKNTIENNISLEFIQSIKAYLERDIIKTYYIYNFWIVGKNEFIVYEILTTGSLSKPSLLLI